MSTRAFLALSVITACACAFGCGDDDDSSSSSGGTGGTGGTAASGGTGGSGGSGGTGATGGSSGSGGVSGADGGGGSAGSGGSSGSDAGGDADASGPAAISITFTLDDTANKTYGAADGLAWKGSFSYDSSKNTIVHDGTWGGPFVPLWDDGPKSSGGHEAAGATAGDHIFTASVSYVADADRTFEYGAIRQSVNGSDGNWIWIGQNGSFTVAKDSTTDVKLPVFALPAFGNVDLKLTIDTGALNSDFSSFDPTTGVKVKGSGWGWTEVALGDAGIAGDETASDGVFTFVLSQHIGAGKTLPHDGKLKSGSTAEFVFVLGGVEYKASGAAATDGVAAATWGPTGTAWTTATVGVTTTTKNTYITVP